MKTCNVCGIAKPLDDFYVNKGGRDGRRPECKDCNLAARRVKYAENPRPYIDRAMKWQRENRERYLARQRDYAGTPAKKLSNRKSHLKRKYGLTLEAFEELLAAQGGGCAICGNPEADNADHDHVTGEVRGIVCFNCNIAIGHVADNKDRLLLAFAYLDRDDELAERTRDRVLALAC